MKKAKSQGFPDYEKPPVIEVVCGIVFETIKGFKGGHLGLFWQKVRDEFPTSEHALRLGFEPEDNVDLTNYFPRIWFINKQQNTLIQLQDNTFFFNWRRMEEEEAYPRYSTIMQAFKKYLGIFDDFLKEEGLGSTHPKSCELTYINHIPKAEGWESLSDINQVFPDFSWNSTGKRFLPEPEHLAGQISFPLPKGQGTLKLTLQYGQRKFDKWPVLVLRNSATGLGADKSMGAVWDWFEVAHEWIVRGFADLTGAKIQKDIWKRTDIN